MSELIFLLIPLFRSEKNLKPKWNEETFAQFIIQLNKQRRQKLMRKWRRWRRREAKGILIKWLSWLQLDFLERSLTTINYPDFSDRSGVEPRPVGSSVCRHHFSLHEATYFTLQCNYSAKIVGLTQMTIQNKGRLNYEKSLHLNVLFSFLWSIAQIDCNQPEPVGGKLLMDLRIQYRHRHSHTTASFLLTVSGT